MKTEIREIVNQVRAIILRYAKPERIYLYGSQVNGDASPGSDVDIAYDDENFKDHHLIEEAVDKLPFLTKIDVRNIARAEDRFKNRVKSTGRVIYSATKKLRVEDGLHNFSSALDRFQNVIEREQSFKQEGFEDVFLDAVVKRFEFTYEMAWKALKRYLDYSGIDAKSPRDVFREAYALQIIKDENIWLDMIERRNLSSHIYDESEIVGILDKKEQYLENFLNLKTFIANAIGNN